MRDNKFVIAFIISMALFIMNISFAQEVTKGNLKKEKIIVHTDKAKYKQSEDIKFTLFNSSSKDIYIPSYEQQFVIALHNQIGFLERKINDKWERIPTPLIQIVLGYIELKPDSKQRYSCDGKYGLGCFTSNDSYILSKFLDGDYLAKGIYRIGLFYRTKQLQEQYTHIPVIKVHVEPSPFWKRIARRIAAYIAVYRVSSKFGLSSMQHNPPLVDIIYSNIFYIE